MSAALQPCLSTCGPPRPTRTPALALAVILAAGCQSDEVSSPDPFSADPWTVSGPEVRIGSLDDPDYVFGPVVGLTPSPDGFLYSLHWGDATIRRWTPDGTPAGSVGRQGEGPGEFERPIRMGFHGDSLWVWDLNAYRVNYFDLEGEFVGSVSPKVEIGGPESSPPRPESPLRDGTFVGQVPAWSDGIARGTLTETPYVHMDGAGETLGRIWAKPHEPRDVFAILNKSGFGGSYSSQPFGDGYMATILEDGLLVLERRAWTGEGDPTVRVSKIGFGGDTLFTAAVPYQPTPMPAERFDSVVQVRTERMAASPGPFSAGEAEIRDALYRPSHLPAVGGMLVAEDGNIWLSRFDPVESETGEQFSEWWILDAEGAPLGRARTPSGLRLVHVGKDVVWGIERDELDVEYIVRYRLARGGKESL